MSRLNCFGLFRFVHFRVFMTWSQIFIFFRRKIKKPRMGIRGFKEGGIPSVPSLSAGTRFSLIVRALLLLGLFLFPLLPAGFPRLLPLHGNDAIADSRLDILKSPFPAASEIRNHYFPEIIDMAFVEGFSLFFENFYFKILFMNINFHFLG